MFQDTGPSAVFDCFLTASSVRDIITEFSQLCSLLNLDPTDPKDFFFNLTESLTSWKAQNLKELFRKRAQQPEYGQQKLCCNAKVLIVGAGPCGLRMAIECALLGCKTVVVEKRARFTRNNVLHIWPFLIEDLRGLGAKLFYPKFCPGSIDHISICQLQYVLLKVALLLGVEIHENVSFVQLIAPTKNEDGSVNGWRAEVSPRSHQLNDYEFDVFVNANGQHSGVPGMRWKEFRGKLAIAITANFVNSHTEDEERVPEISGVAYIFKQQFFREMREKTGIDLENIVYYKDETHYFVMTAKKQSLLSKGVLIKDHEEVSVLLSSENINQEKLQAYAREAADFATEYSLPYLDFALNYDGLPEVAVFDFTSLYSAESACRLFQRCSRKLLIAIVGDSLHEPFWPTGSGCARGFLGVLDAAWMIRNYCSGRYSVLEVLAERDSIYKLLAQCTPNTLNQNIRSYTIDPRSRYPSLESSVLPPQVCDLIDTDDWSEVEEACTPLPSPIDYGATFFVEQSLVTFFQQVVAPYRLRVDNLTVSFWNGLALSAVLHRCCPAQFEDFFEMKASNARQNLCFACYHIRKLWNIEPPSSLNKKEMFLYLSKIFSYLQQTGVPPPDVFLVRLPASTAGDVAVPSAAERNVREAGRSQASERPFSCQSLAGGRRVMQTCMATRPLHQERLDKANDLIFNRGDKQTSVNSSLSRYRTHRLDEGRLLVVDNLLKGRKPGATGFGGARNRATRRPPIICRKLDPQEIKEMEEKLKLTALGCLLYHRKEPNLTSKDAKIIAKKTSLLKERAANGFKEPDERFSDFDRTAKELDKHLRLPNKTGAVGVAQLAKLHSSKIDEFAVCKRKPPVPLPPEARKKVSSTPSAPSLTAAVVQSSSVAPYTNCMVCRAAVYLAERVCIENHVCHRDCFRCTYCRCPLRLNSYGSEFIDGFGKLIFCLRHLNLSLSEKLRVATAAKAAINSRGNYTEQPNRISGGVPCNASPTTSSTEELNRQNRDSRDRNRIASWYRERDDVGRVEVTGTAGILLSKSDEIRKGSNSSEEDEEELPLARKVQTTCSLIDLRPRSASTSRFPAVDILTKKSHSLPSCVCA